MSSSFTEVIITCISWGLVSKVFFNMMFTIYYQTGTKPARQSLVKFQWSWPLPGNSIWPHTCKRETVCIWCFDRRQDFLLQRDKRYFLEEIQTVRSQHWWSLTECWNFNMEVNRSGELESWHSIDQPLYIFKSLLLTFLTKADLTADTNTLLMQLWMDELVSICCFMP